MIDPRHEPNRVWWDEVTPVHAKSEFYDVDSFLKGRDTLKSIETESLGDVSGKSLLHLQCHFGMDTLSWGRRGAKAVGADFSPEAIKKARELAEKIGSHARFVESDVLKLPEALAEKFDIVFTSYGAINWLADIERWAEVVAHFLKPGGRFLVVECHPFSQVFDQAWDGNRCKIEYPYFPAKAGLKLESDGMPDYADRNYIPVAPTVEWNWSVAQVQNALLKAGLRLGELKEFPFTVYPQFTDMKEDADGYWRRPKDSIDLPLLYSLSATKG